MELAPVVIIKKKKLLKMPTYGKSEIWRYLILIHISPLHNQNLFLTVLSQSLPSKYNCRGDRRYVKFPVEFVFYTQSLQLCRNNPIENYSES